MFTVDALLGTVLRQAQHERGKREAQRELGRAGLGIQAPIEHEETP